MNGGKGPEKKRCLLAWLSGSELVAKGGKQAGPILDWLGKWIDMLGLCLQKRGIQCWSTVNAWLGSQPVLA